MKPAETPQAAPEAPVRVEYKVQFVVGPKGQRRARGDESTAALERKSPDPAVASPAPKPAETACTDRIPKITRLLVLGHHFENLVREGVVKDYAGIARLTGLSRARVTQITNLAMLAPSIQEEILILSLRREPQKVVNERKVRALGATIAWGEQRQIWSSDDLVAGMTVAVRLSAFWSPTSSSASKESS